MAAIEKRDCGDCGAKPGELHEHGCDVEGCLLCGNQAISCGCIYEFCNVNEEDHPDIFNHGPTGEMCEAFDSHIEKLGGRLPWTGEFPGCAECREFDLWCYWDDKRGWVKCEADHPKARENLNRLLDVAEWSVAERRFVRRK